MNLLINLCDYFLLKIHCFVWYIIFPLFSILYFSPEITLGRVNIFSSPPLPLGQRGPGYFKTKTIQHGPLCPLTFNGCMFHKLIPVNEVFSILPRIMSNKACHHIHQMKGFFISVLLSSLRCTHLCIRIKKKYPKWAWAPLPNALVPLAQAKGATLRANLFGL